MRFEVELLDVVELGEVPAGVGRAVLLELASASACRGSCGPRGTGRAGPGVLDEAVDGVDGGERLARARRHLDERAGLVAGERALQARDRLDLAVAQVPVRRAAAAPGGGRGASSGCASHARSVSGRWKREHGPAARARVALVAEVRLASRSTRRRTAAAAGRAGRSSASPSRYLADCSATPESVVPAGLASTTPTALPSDEEQVVGRARRRAGTRGRPRRAPAAQVHRL